MLTKQEEFLWIVQTTVLANALSLAADPERTVTFRHEHSATGVFMTADEAIRASKLIPDSLSSADAANEFITFMLSNLRKAEEKADGKRQVCPSWFVRH